MADQAEERKDEEADNRKRKLEEDDDDDENDDDEYGHRRKKRHEEKEDKERPQGASNQSRDDRDSRRNDNRDRDRDRHRGGYNRRDNYRNDRYRDRDGGGRRGGGRDNNVITPEARIRMLLVKVGDEAYKKDQVDTLTAHLKGLGVALEKDIVDYQELIINVLIECVIGFSFKTPIYATLTALLNTSTPAVVDEIISKSTSRLVDTLKAGDTLKSKMLVRFFAELVNCNTLDCTSFINLLQTFIEAATESVEKNRIWSRNLVLIVLSALPFCGSKLFDAVTNQVIVLMNNIDSYIKAYPVTANSNLVRSHKIIQDLANDDWPSIACILRPYDAFKTELSLDENKKSLDAFSFDFEIPINFVTINPFYLKLFDKKVATPVEEGKQLDGLSEASLALSRFKEIELFVLQQYIWDVLFSYQPLINEVATAVMQLPTELPVEHVIVDAIINEMMRVDNHKMKLPPTYFQVILIQLCKSHRTTIPLVVEDTVDAIYTKVNQLDVEMTDIVTDWVSFHLVTFDLKWPWVKWVKCVTQYEDDDLRKLYVIQIIQRIQRLSFRDRLLKALPGEMHYILQQHSTTGSCMFFKNESDPSNTTYNELYLKHGESLAALFRKKGDKETFIKELEAIALAAKEVHDDLNTEKYKVELFTYMVLQIGSRSFTHLVKALELGLPMFRTICDTNPTQIWVMECIAKFWCSNNQWLTWCIMKFLSFGILPPDIPINWLLSSFQEIKSANNTLIMYEWWRWQLFHVLIQHIVYKAVDINIKLDEVRDKYSILTTEERQLKVVNSNETEAVDGETETAVEKTSQVDSSAANALEEELVLAKKNQIKHEIEQLTNQVGQLETDLLNITQQQSNCISQIFIGLGNLYIDYKEHEKYKKQILNRSVEIARRYSTSIMPILQNELKAELLPEYLAAFKLI